ncbi:MAG: prolipoprotein diacylglyceryl transferase [Bacilli bacterium]|nr:prolipoprotein diacylglyceryl transferase [Bacilli bacterium]
MNAIAIVLLIFGLITLGGGIYFLVKNVREFLKNDMERSLLDRKKGFSISLVLILAGGALLGAVLFSGHPEWANKTVYEAGSLFEGQAINYVANYVLSTIGAGFLAAVLAAILASFTIYFKKTKIKNRKIPFWIMIGGIPFAIAFFLMWTNGFGPYLYYPLVNGFYLGASFGFTTTAGPKIDGTLRIAFYAIIIISGALISYFVSSYYFKKKYGTKGMLDTLFVVAFLGGILGARVWYVVGNWNREFAHAENPFLKALAITDGGLTILGGAFLGVVVGFIFLRLTQKKTDPRFAIDVCVPTILLAQAVGRWGNFFNVEVYGSVVNINSGWSWLPNWFLLQMNCINGSLEHLGPGLIHVPLFFIESLFTFGGYFLIKYGIGKGLKKWIVPGDLCGLYFLYYGLVRISMEPMRDTTFNMGTDNSWSMCNALIYIAIGLGIISMFHLHDYMKKENAKKWLPGVCSIALMVMAVLFQLLPSLTGSASITDANPKIYGGFELIFSGKAPTYLVSFIILCLSIVAYLVYLFFNEKGKEKEANIVNIVASSSALLGAAMIILGQNWVALNDGSAFYSLYYGFTLAGVLPIWAAVLSFDRLPRKKKGAPTVEEPAKEEAIEAPKEKEAGIAEEKA